MARDVILPRWTRYDFNSHCACKNMLCITTVDYELSDFLLEGIFCPCQYCRGVYTVFAKVHMHGASSVMMRWLIYQLS